AIRKFFIWYALPLVTGTAIFIWYQYHELGVWFAFFKQERHWGHEFAWPTFPLSTIHGPVMLWLNALALFVGFVSLVALIVRGLQWLRSLVPDTNRVRLFSFLYLTAVLFITLLFSSTWGHGKTNVYDANRYALATPFFWVFLHHYLKEKEYTYRDFIVVFIVSNLFWLMFGSYLHIMQFVYFGFNTAIIMLYMVYAKKPLGWPAMAIAAFNFFIQVFGFQLYLSGVPFT
ncbi:MAG: hypothetical protein K0R82_2564, partial [Flavipsychrobacter sp.]|nr:hypothetical protein [Flavipsychrobacter sp.]